MRIETFAISSPFVPSIRYSVTGPLKQYLALHALTIYSASIFFFKVMMCAYSDTYLYYRTLQYPKGKSIVCVKGPVA